MKRTSQSPRELLGTSGVLVESSLKHLAELRATLQFSRALTLAARRQIALTHLTLRSHQGSAPLIVGQQKTVAGGFISASAQASALLHRADQSPSPPPAHFRNQRRGRFADIR
jgi:hypothetical protein